MANNKNRPAILDIVDKAWGTSTQTKQDAYSSSAEASAPPRSAPSSKKFGKSIGRRKPVGTIQPPPRRKP